MPAERCRCCSAPGVPTQVCAACYREPPAFAELAAPFLYDGLARELVLSLKYHGHRHLGPLLGEAAVVVAPQGADGVVPVPLHPRRQAERGFNQSALIATTVAERLGVPLLEGALSRTRETPPQAGLNAAERKVNVRGAFAAPARLEGRTLLLVDDVCTTGATIDACARALRRAGAARVLAVTATRAADML